MKKSRQIFWKIFAVFFHGTFGLEGEVEPYYNDACPLPDLADLCQNECTQDLTKCLLSCGIDEGNGLHGY